MSIALVAIVLGVITGRLFGALVCATLDELRDRKV